MSFVPLRMKRPFQKKYIKRCALEWVLSDVFTLEFKAPSPEQEQFNDFFLLIPD